jgi:hypothetical protein
MTLTACQPEYKAKPIADLENQYPEIRKKYVYQSLIRLANINRDPNFEKLIRDLEKVVIYMPRAEDSTFQVTSLRSGLREENYEELLDIRTEQQQRINLWVKETGSQSHYLCLVDSDTEDLILELDGQIHIEYLSALTLADQGSLQKMLMGGF